MHEEVGAAEVSRRPQHVAPPRVWRDANTGALARAIRIFDAGVSKQRPDTILMAPAARRRGCDASSWMFEFKAAARVIWIMVAGHDAGVI